MNSCVGHLKFRLEYHCFNCGTTFKKKRKRCPVCGGTLTEGSI